MDYQVYKNKLLTFSKKNNFNKFYEIKEIIFEIANSNYYIKIQQVHGMNEIIRKYE